MDCIFCKIANGDIPSTTVYEDDDFKVILDINPANLGHSLVICKHHYANILEMPEELTAKAFAVAKKVAIAVNKVTNCEVVIFFKIMVRLQVRLFSISIFILYQDIRVILLTLNLVKSMLMLKRLLKLVRK